MVTRITERLAAEVAERAAASARRRMNFNFHEGPTDNPHRFLNVLLRGTYIRPHRHLDPPKTEAFIALDGEADVLIFDDAGNVVERHRLGRSGPDGILWGVDLPVGVWHTVVARSERVVCYEVKPGPWEPSTDKAFAPWAPSEGDPAVEAYLATLTDDD
jgi:cupin fold WbuC family metalloprotein